MGFTKRFFSKNLIKTQIDNGSTLDKIFNVDAYIFEDKISEKIYKLYLKGVKDDEIIKKMFKNG